MVLELDILVPQDLPLKDIDNEHFKEFKIDYFCN